MKRTCVGLVWVLALGMTVACASGTSGPAGSVDGIAVDQRGNVMPGITVSIQTSAGKTVYSIVTAENGSYSFPDIPVGQYQVVTHFAGFTARPLDVSVTADHVTKMPNLVVVAVQDQPLTFVTPTPKPK